MTTTDAFSASDTLKNTYSLILACQRDADYLMSLDATNDVDFNQAIIMVKAQLDATRQVVKNALMQANRRDES